jgi:nicotinamide-nucleotide amidase
MARETRINKTIALLATGDEISQGDILNTNSHDISLMLTKLCMQVRTHMTVPDTIVEIEEALHFLLSHHDALIITGGLGPTSDDLTRFALAEVLQEELEFNQPTWDSICQRLKKFGYATPPESNRQQAFFPLGATILPNPNGTAAGCYLIKNDKLIFMLPGPPIECLPMMQTVIAELQAHHFSQTFYTKNWFLFGVSEGQIAEELDGLVANTQCVTGYRLFYPYIEFKIQSQDKTEFEAMVKKIEAMIRPHLIDDQGRIASDILKEKIVADRKQVTLQDTATGGALECKLVTPETHGFIKFTDDNNQDFHVVITGLEDYWNNVKDATQTTLCITTTVNKVETQKEISVPFRGARVIQFAVEYICRHLLSFQQKAKSVSD